MYKRSLGKSGAEKVAFRQTTGQESAVFQVIAGSTKIPSG